ncbi:MAG: ABC transporter ATP-binding protein [Planctomycetes bacterium]|nr:ABC transporter ATP-binding protein [Planctomycetota bacterium]
MSSEPVLPQHPGAVVRTTGLGKCYHVYKRPQDRLRQFFARGGRRHYTEFWALRDIDLEVRRGETLGIVGRNGAGKSTLLELIAGTLKPTTGSVDVRGRVTALLELGSGFHQDFTGRENVYVAGALLGLERDEMNRRMAAIERFADIGEFLDRAVKTYSKGMFARLSFAVYANLDPDIFIVDEALAVGDAKFRHKCMYRFKQMQEQGVAVIYVSHDAASMKHLCDRVAWIHQGRLQQVGEPTHIVDDYLAHLFHDQQPKAQRGVVTVDGAVRGDDDMGSRAAVFTRCELLGADGRPTDHLTGGEPCSVRLEVRNDRLEPGRRLVVGISISNVHGLAITGTNNLANDVVVLAPEPGAMVTLCYRFTLPVLATGSYAISPMLLELRDGDDMSLLHSTPNAIAFTATTAMQVFSMLGLPCEVRIEPPAQGST